MSKFHKNELNTFQTSIQTLSEEEIQTLFEYTIFRSIFGHKKIAHMDMNDKIQTLKFTDDTFQTHGYYYRTLFGRMTFLSN